MAPDAGSTSSASPTIVHAIVAPSAKARIVLSFSLFFLSVALIAPIARSWDAMPAASDAARCGRTPGALGLGSDGAASVLGAVGELHDRHPRRFDATLGAGRGFYLVGFTWFSGAFSGLSRMRISSRIRTARHVTAARPENTSVPPICGRR